MPDNDDRWMSYRELSQARGTSHRAAIVLARRHKWPKQQGNDGTVRVLVPGHMSQIAASNEEAKPDTGHRDRAIALLEETFAELRVVHSARVKDLLERIERSHNKERELSQALDVARRRLAELEELKITGEGRGGLARLWSLWRAPK